MFRRRLEDLLNVLYTYNVRTLCERLRLAVKTSVLQMDLNHPIFSFFIRLLNILTLLKITDTYLELSRTSTMELP